MHRHWFRQLFSRVRAPQSSRRTGRRPSTQLRLEGLEDRRVPAVYVSITNGVLTAVGDNAGNAVQLSHANGMTELAGFQFADSSFDSISINPGDGNYNAVQVLGTPKPTTIYSGRGLFEGINIGASNAVLDLEAQVTVIGQAAFSASLAYNDQANPTPGLAYTLSANGNAGSVQRNGLGTVSYQGITGLTVNVAAPANQTVNVIGTATGVPTTVTGSGARDLVNVGVPNQLLALAGPLIVNESGTSAQIAYNDQDNPTNALTYTISANGGTGRVQRTGLGDLTFTGVNTLGVYTGTAGNQTVNVLSTRATPGGTSVFGGHGNDAINVGVPTALLDLPYPLAVNETTTGTKTLNYNDQADPTNSLTYTLFSGLITGGGAIDCTGLAELSFANITDLVINPGSAGNNTVNVSATACPQTTVHGGGGADTINVGDAIGELRLPDPLAVIGDGGGTTTVTYNDQENPTGPFTYTLSGTGTNGRVQRNGLADLTYAGIDALTVNTATTPNQIVNVLSTANSTATTVNGGRGNNVITLGNAGSLAGITAPVTVTNATTTNRLLIDDTADTADRSASVTATGITGLAPAALNFTASSIGTLSVLGGSRNNTYTVAGTPAATAMTLDTGSGMDAVNVQAASAPLTVQTTGMGGAGHDVVTFGDAGSVAGIIAPVTVMNLRSQDQMIVDDSADPAAHPGIVIGTGGITGLAPGAININASSTDTLTVLGGAGNNNYLITDTPAATLMALNTGAGVDTVTVQATTAPLTIDSSSGSGADVITLGGAPNALSFITAGVTVNANATDSLVLSDQGFAGGRTFAVTDTTVSWGGPTVTYAGVGALTIQGGTGGNTFIVLATSATAAVTIDGGSAADTLVGSDAGNLFTITDADTGTLNGNAYAMTVAFNEIGNMTAGAGGDTFVFADQASFTGNLTGGGADTLDYTAYTTSVIVDRQTGFATGVGGSVSGIQNVIGGSGSPASSGVYNLLIGAGGDTLTGGTGRRNILVAGGSASTLNAGDQDDLLIGGTTLYDTEAGLTSWLQIASYWAGTDDFFTRVANLTSGTGVPVLDATTVTGTGGSNVLNGNGGLALIYSDGLDSVAGFDPNSATVAINP